MDTGQGIVLIGEAANRWVTLEWVKFFFGAGIVIIVVIIIILFFVAVLQHEDT